MRKIKNKIIILVWMMLLALISISPIVFADKAYCWLVTDEVIDPEEVFTYKEYIWTDNDPVQQTANFEWHVDKGTSRGGSLFDSEKPIGGTKATLSMTGSGNDLQLNIIIYKGGAKNPTAGPEEYQWTIINGKNSDNNCINVEFINTITAKTIAILKLYENDVANIGIPHVLTFECKMWLL